MVRKTVDTWRLNVNPQYTRTSGTISCSTRWMRYNQPSRYIIGNHTRTEVEEGLVDICPQNVHNVGLHENLRTVDPISPASTLKPWMLALAQQSHCSLYIKVLWVTENLLSHWEWQDRTRRPPDWQVTASSTVISLWWNYIARSHQFHEPVNRKSAYIYHRPQHHMSQQTSKNSSTRRYKGISNYQLAPRLPLIVIVTLVPYHITMLNFDPFLIRFR